MLLAMGQASALNIEWADKQAGDQVTHADMNDIKRAVNSKQDAATAATDDELATAIANHEAGSDRHPEYQKAAEMSTAVPANETDPVFSGATGADIGAKFSGTDDYLKRDGTTGTPPSSAVDTIGWDYTPRSEAPVSPVVGKIYLADGAASGGWDPLGYNPDGDADRDYYVLRTPLGWVGVVDIYGNLFMDDISVAMLDVSTDVAGLLAAANYEAIRALLSLSSLATTTPGTGIATALGVNVGSAGAPVINGGALGTPSSGTLTNATGLPLATGISGLGTGVATALGVNVGSAGAMTRTIALGTASLGTSQIASGACASAVTVGATGTATSDIIGWGFSGDPTSTTGYQATADGMLTIIAYPTANNVNFRVCNNTASAITPGAVTLNWKVIR